MSSCAAPRWTQLPAMPEASGGFIAGGVGDHLVIAGGTNWSNDVKHWSKATHALSRTTLKWDDTPTFAPWDLPAPLGYAVSGIHAGKMVFAGGSTGVAPSGLLGRVTFGDVSTAALPLKAVLAAGGVIGDELIVVGGCEDAAELAGLRRAAFAVNLRDGGSLRSLPDFPGQAFGTAASAVAGETLFVFGGANWDAAAGTVKNTDVAYAFEKSSNVWRRCKSLPSAVRGLSAVTLDADTIYLAGGYPSDERGFTDEAWFYHVKADTYTRAPRLPYAAMVSIVVHDGYVYCLGGEDQKKSRTDKCYRIAVADLLGKGS
ncbi:MAG: hypothetical protein KDK97_01250 [Verrucomicrobiales bacterium]|nr:hypothetical protein [Verrucomicrobiales bacterium]